MINQSAAKNVLIITEKPDAAERIAIALDKDGKPTRKAEGILPYFVTSGDRSLTIVPALGHLYTIGEDKKVGKKTIQAFSYRWLPRFKVERGSNRIRYWIAAIEKLAKNAAEYINACDYDVEGSLIGYNILKYACHGKENIAKRMKYSTLTEQDLRNSYENMHSNLDFGNIEAGLVRHEVDWLYGISISRALTDAVKTSTGKYSLLSTGRVQGPTLKLVVERDRKIKLFAPSPFWTVAAELLINDRIYCARFEKDKLESQDEANQIVEACKNRTGVIERVEYCDYTQPPPFPFDLGTLQSEAYRLFGIMPKRTAEIAQKLYINALISYPRTNSQKLPASIGYKTILRRLDRIPQYSVQSAKLLNKSTLRPSEGKKTDSAHPAIYPTGKLPSANAGRSENALWDLIARRFMASFGEPALKRDIQIYSYINGYRFIIQATAILNEGWYPIYDYTLSKKSECMPDAKAGQNAIAKTVIAIKDFTKPPPRYNPASLLRAMEKVDIGTKATRAEIIQTLYQREYIKGKTIESTNLGTEVVNTLNRYCPSIVSLKFTQELEQRMEQINTSTLDRNVVIEEAKRALKPSLRKLQANKKEIGKNLSRAMAKIHKAERTIGNCPVCKSGKLIAIRSRKTKKLFIGCTNYFKGKCKTSAPLPQKGTITSARENCTVCQWPIVNVFIPKRRPWRLCTNPNCPTKK